jgi:hypothetical protein
VLVDDWRLLAAATFLSLVSPPATSSRQRVSPPARPATPSTHASSLAPKKQTRDMEKEVAETEEYSNVGRLSCIQLSHYVLSGRPRWA